MSTSDDGKKPSVGSSTDRPAKKRINKPLIEKRRRERINECLNQLQTMITQLDKDKSKRRSSKLEKADILEMTVEFIKNGRVTTKYEKSESVDKTDTSCQYMEGYKKCVEEINTFFRNSTNVSQELKSSILGHVSKTLDTEADAYTTKSTDEKHSPINQTNSLNCANIKPKLLPATSALPISGTNTLQPSTSGLIIQPAVKQTLSPPSGNQYAMIYNRPDIPTYVLVPTATLCQSLQLNVGSQGVPNGNPVAVLNNTESCGPLIHTVTSDNAATNCNQIVVLPPNPPLSQAPCGFLGNLPSSQSSNCITGPVPPSLAFRDVNQQLGILSRPVIGNCGLQPQQHPQADNDNTVWRPW